MYRRKSSDDISLKSWILWIGCCVLGRFYSIATYVTQGFGLALVFTDIMTLVFISVTITLIVRYRGENALQVKELEKPFAAIAHQADAIATISSPIKPEKISEKSREVNVVVNATAERTEGQQR